MKRIIAFVFLGLLIYAGVFVIVYGARDIAVNTSTPVPMSGVFHNGEMVRGTVGRYIGVLDSRKIQDKLLGIPIGEPITQNLYIITTGNPEKPNYMLLAVSGDDIADAEKMPGEQFSFTGLVVDMDVMTMGDLAAFLVNYPKLIDAENAVYTSEIIAHNRITPYVITVCEPGNPDYTSLIIGIAMCAVGLGLAALLALKIFRERSGY